MVQFFILALALVLLVYVVKLNNKLGKFNKTLDNFTANIFEEFNQVKVDIANSTDKLQDRICGVDESIDGHQKDMDNIIKIAFSELLQQMKLVEKSDVNNTKNIVSTAMKDAAAHRQDIYNTAKDTYNRITTHDNYVVAHNKEVRQILSELLSAIQALSVAKTDNISTDATNEVEKPKRVIRRNKRKYTKDTEEVKE